MTVSPYSDSLSLRLRSSLNLATDQQLDGPLCKKYAVTPKGSDHLSAHGFGYYFTPLPGFFSPFPHGTSSLSVTREYLALQGGPRRFRPRFTAAVLLRIFDRQVSALSPTGRLPSVVRGSTRFD